MPEWLTNPSFSQVIAVLGVIGGIIAGAVNLRDRTHRRTVESLNASINHLGLLLDDARHQISEGKASEAKIRDEKDLAERHLALANDKIGELTETVTFKGVSFLRHQSDPPNFSPICAKCLLPMTQNGPYVYCPNDHKVSVSVVNAAMSKYVDWMKSSHGKNQ